MKFKQNTNIKWFHISQWSKIGMLTIQLAPEYSVSMDSISSSSRGLVTVLWWCSQWVTTMLPESSLMQCNNSWIFYDNHWKVLQTRNASSIYLLGTPWVPKLKLNLNLLTLRQDSWKLISSEICTTQSAVSCNCNDLNPLTLQYISTYEYCFVRSWLFKKKGLH